MGTKLEEEEGMGAKLEEEEWPGLGQAWQRRRDLVGQLGIWLGEGEEQGGEGEEHDGEGEEHDGEGEEQGGPRLAANRQQYAQGNKKSRHGGAQTILRCEGI